MLVLSRAAYLQFLPHKKLSALHDRQFKTVVNLPARRGNIVDREGKDLAMSSPAYSIYADPSIIESPRSVAKTIATLLNERSSGIYSKLKDKDKKFIWIDRLVSASTVEKLKEKKIRGIGFVEEWKRVYPNEYMLSTILGFIGKEGQGLEGLELMYDKELKGENKKMTLLKDAKGRPIIQDGMMFKEVPQGKELKLTIDSDLQFFVETELQQAVKKFEAEAAYAVVLDAKTSAIRAMTSLPHYDLNNPQKYSSSSRRNRTITDTFEPGSTLKTFIIADALEKKIYTPKSKIFCENGRFKIGKRVIREAEQKHSQGLITVSEVLAVSSNIGTSKIALKMGDAEVQKALINFGFGKKMGLDMPGEAKGIMVPLPWNDHLIANVSFGQGMTATPIQMANAYAAIANGGVLNTPHIIESIVDTESGEQESKTPARGERIISEKTAQAMVDMLVGVTADEGTGVSARVSGYTVAGKTGTAQKIKPKGRGYLPGGYIASFAGFIPAHDPQYVIFIAVDHPKKQYYGSTVAAPVFSSIASYAVRKEGIRPELLTETADKRSVASQIVLDFEEHKEPVKHFSSDDLSSESEVITAAPDLKNHTIREVLDQVNDKQIKVRFIGSGKVYQTNPDAGEALNGDRKMTVFLKE